MKLWQRPHEQWSIGNDFHADQCYYCFGKMDDGPCPARTVRLSDDPRAVRILKGIGKLLRIYRDISTDIEYEIKKKNTGEKLRAAVRAYWGEA